MVGGRWRPDGDVCHARGPRAVAVVEATVDRRGQRQDGVCVLGDGELQPRAERGWLLGVGANPRAFVAAEAWRFDLDLPWPDVEHRRRKGRGRRHHSRRTRLHERRVVHHAAEPPVEAPDTEMVHALRDKVSEDVREASRRVVERHRVVDGACGVVRRRQLGQIGVGELRGPRGRRVIRGGRVLLRAALVAAAPQ